MWKDKYNAFVAKHRLNPPELHGSHHNNPRGGGGGGKGKGDRRGGGKSGKGEGSKRSGGGKGGGKGGRAQGSREPQRSPSGDSAQADSDGWQTAGPKHKR